MSWMRGEGEAWQGGRQGGSSSSGSNSRGAEGHDQSLVEEEEPFGLRGKVHRRTSWVEQAWHREGLLQRAQKAWAYGTSDHLLFHLRKSVRL